MPADHRFCCPFPLQNLRRAIYLTSKLGRPRYPWNTGLSGPRAADYHPPAINQGEIRPCWPWRAESNCFGFDCQQFAVFLCLADTRPQRAFLVDSPDLATETGLCVTQRNEML